MKKILFFIALLFSVCSYGQVKQVYSQYGGDWKKFYIRTGLRLPQSPISTKDLNLPAMDTGQIYYNPADSSIYYHTGFQWIKAGTGGSGSGISELGTSPYGLILVDDSTYKVDTSVIETKLDSRRKIDSVLALITGGAGVTSVATNNGSGITGGTITTTGTLAIDTVNISTKYNAKRVADSSATAVVAGYVPTTRTITAVSPVNGGGDLSTNRSIGVDTTQSTNNLVNHGRLKQKLDSIKRAVDSLLADLTLYTENVPGNGSAKANSFVDNDTLKVKGLADGTFINITTRSDSANVPNLDTANAALKAYIALYGNDGGGGGALSYDSTYGNGTDSIWVDTSYQGGRIAFKDGRGWIKRLAIVDSISSTPPVEFDDDAEAFFAAASISDDTQKEAINQLVLDLKDAGVWTDIKVIYPFVGGTATTHKYNLKDPDDDDASFRITFSGGWTHNSTGIVGNGSNAKGVTHFNPDAQFTDDEFAYMGVWLAGTSETGEYIPVGCRDGVADFYIKTRSASNILDITLNTAGTSGGGVGTPLGYSSGTHKTGGLRTFKDGTPLSPLSSLSPGTANYDVNIGCLNNVGGDYGFISSTIQAIIIGDRGFSDAEDLAIYNALLAYKTTLGR